MFEFPEVICAAVAVSISATDLSLILGRVALTGKRRPQYTKPRGNVLCEHVL